MVSAAIYVRLSDEDKDKLHKEDESESIQNQKSMLVDYCKERNWNIYDIYNDENYSGTDRNRPEFNRMLNDCKNGNIDIVLCKSQSRFSRDAVIIESYLHDKFVEWGVRFIGVVDHTDTNDRTNKKARQVNALVNEWYVEEVSENIRTVLRHKREQGQFTGSFAPYGYLIDPQNKNHLIVDSETAPVVKDIYNWYAQGWGYRKIVLELNDREIPSPSSYKRLMNSKYINKNEERSHSSGMWTLSTIYTILRNETYTGTLVQGKSHNVSYKNKKKKPVPKDDWIRVPNSHEAIIDGKLWDIVAERLKSRIRTNKTTNELSPLSGKVKCAICKKPMKRNVYYNKLKTIQYYNLQCATYKVGAMNCPNNKSMSGLLLEKEIIKQINTIIERLCNKNKIEIDDINKNNLAKLRDELSAVSEQIQTKEHKVEKLYEDKLDGLITKDQYISFSKKFTTEIETLNQRKKSLENRLNELQSQEKSLQADELIEKYSHIEKLTKEIVDDFIEVIYVGEYSENNPREISIVWKF